MSEPRFERMAWMLKRAIDEHPQLAEQNMRLIAETLHQVWTASMEAQPPVAEGRAPTETPAIRAAARNPRIAAMITTICERIERGDASIGRVSEITGLSIADLMALNAWRKGVAPTDTSQTSSLNDTECDNDIGPRCAVLYPTSRASWCEGCLNRLIEPPTETPERLRAEMMRLRQSLWANHGCSLGVLYADDGEMQCCDPAHGPFDFKRDDLISIVHRLLVGARRQPDVRAQLAAVRATFDPGGTLPEDCADWAAEHDAAIDALAATLTQPAITIEPGYDIRGQRVAPPEPHETYAEADARIKAEMQAEHREDQA